MDAREQRGIVIAALTKLDRKGAEWVVPSQSSPEKRYTVDAERKTCTCPDHTEWNHVCKHIHAVMFTIKREVDLFGNVTETKSVTFTEKKTYTQNWPAYNEAQQHEKYRFQSLLADLCRGVKEAEQKIGRPRTPLADIIFAVVSKVYSTVSSRRFACDLNDAYGEGYLSKPMHPNKVNCHLENPELTVILKDLIRRSSLPLAAVEKDFAVDSTGFSVARHVRWIDEKYGCKRSGRDWVKAHICCGVTTGIVTAVEIKGRDAHDSPILPELVAATARNFKLGDVTADKGYLSQENVETIHHLGGTAYIAPKMNTTGGVGGLFEKMFLYYQYKRDVFLAHYHKRSNVESVFSSIKRKFGDHVRSKTDTAMVNEALCKFLCHNLCCVIQSQCELGIEAEFYKENQGACASHSIQNALN